MKALSVIVALSLLTAPLAAQGSAAGTNPAKASLSRKEVKHLRKVKKQALQLSTGDSARVRLTDHTQVEGSIVDVSDRGVSVVERATGRRHQGKPGTKHLPPLQFIPFEQIQNIKFLQAGQWVPFESGVVFGLLGPLGWWVTWLEATGRGD